MDDMAFSKRDLVPAAPDALAARKLWLEALSGERRCSPKTLDAYERDSRQFLAFLSQHLGGPPTLQDLATLRTADYRAFLTARRRDGAGARTLGRGLAGVRSFLRHLERQGQGNAAAANAARAPRQPKSLPKPLPADRAIRLADADEHLNEEAWQRARNAAILT